MFVVNTQEYFIQDYKFHIPNNSSLSVIAIKLKVKCRFCMGDMLFHTLQKQKEK